MSPLLRPADRTPAALMYDRDCGFCRWTVSLVMAWDRPGLLRPLPIQSEEGRALLGPIPEEHRLDSMHLAGADGTLTSGGGAFPGLLARLPGGGPLARLARARPEAADAFYRWVAEHRTPFGKAVRRLGRVPDEL